MDISQGVSNLASDEQPLAKIARASATKRLPQGFAFEILHHQKRPPGLFAVIAFYDYGEEAGRPFLVMEYFEGETLREALRGGRTGDLRKRLLIARQVANALAYVHSKGIVHRDVKPDNVRINASGDVKLMDFGVAKSGDLSLTASGFTVGTPYYMAPEQIRGAKPAHKVDIYAFGVVLFELITEMRPFEAPTPSEIFDLILSRPLDTTPLVRLGVPSSLVDLIRAATANHPARRAQD